MRIIKLNAIPSTNDYCKQLINSGFVEDFLTVQAEWQTHGKGQMGNLWSAEKGSSLTFSFIKHFSDLDMGNLFVWNALVSISCVSVLRKLNLTNIYVKWPNDILAENKKVGGILIENSIKNDKNCITINGIGINLKPITTMYLPHVSDLYSLYQHNIHASTLMIEILREIEHQSINWMENKDNIWTIYHQYLYGLNAMCNFIITDGNQFSATIIGVNPNGKLVLKMENNVVNEYGLKEIKMIY